MFQLFRSEIFRKHLCGSRIQTLLLRNRISSTSTHYCDNNKNKKSKANPAIITKIKNLLKREPKKATKIYAEMSLSSKLFDDASISDTLNILIENGITIQTIMQNPWLFNTCKYALQLFISFDV